MKYIDTWDLDAIFPGRTKSPELQSKLHKIKVEIQEYQKLILEWNMTENKSVEPLKAILRNRNHR